VPVSPANSPPDGYRTPGLGSGVFRVYLLYALSGFVSLGYQVAWFRIVADRFGSTNLTFALVVCSFIGGLGVGAMASRRLCSFLSGTTGIRDRLRLYGLIELLVTLTVLLTFAAAALPPDLWGDFPYHLAGGNWHPNLGYRLSQVGITMACVFVPSFFMGVTFPLLCDVYRGIGGSSRFPSALYAWNTMGACSGVLACLFIFLPWFGHMKMLWLLAAGNLAIAIVFLVWGGAPRTDDTPPEPASPAAPARARGFLFMAAVLSGLLAGALEGDMFKRIDFISSGDSAVMALVSFWAILAIFLASWAVRVVRTMDLRRIKMAWVAGFIAYAAAWQFEGAIQHGFWLLESREQFESEIMQLGFYGGFLGSLFHTLLFVGLFVFPAYFCVSLLLPWVCNRFQGLHRHLGLAYGVNTLAFCAGLIGFTMVAPRVSVFYSLKLIMVLFGIAVVLLLVSRESRPVKRWQLAAAVAAMALGCVVTPRGFDPGYMVPGSIAATKSVRALKSNGAHTTYVVSAPEGDYLFFERHPMSGAVMPQGAYMRLMAHMPLLAHPDPKRALLICYGVGMTASAIAAHDSIEAIDIVELNVNVVETAPEFGPQTGDVHLDPRVRFIIGDGRNFLAMTGNRYDLVTSEPPPPMQAGTYRLYTREYYRQVLGRLEPNGMMTQWIPSYQMPVEAAELVIRTFIDVFDHALIFTGGEREFILVGSPDPIDLRTLERRFHEQPTVNADLRRLGIRSPLAMIARIVQGDAALRRRFADGPLIGDMHNDLEFLFRAADQPEVLTYAPLEVLRDIDADGLACGPQLRRVLTHFGRLRYHVPAFPIAMLLTARQTGAGSVQLAGIDWEQVTAHLERFAAMRGQGRLAQAERALRDALAIAGEQPQVLLRLATLQLRAGKLAAAEQTLRRFMQIEPDDAVGHRLLGVTLARRGQADQALAALTAAVESDPYSPEARLALGRTLLGQGRTQDGIAHLREAVKLAPDNEEIQRALRAAEEG